MSDGLNTVSVLRVHLEDMKRTLDFVEGLLVSQDLQAEYRKMGTLNRPSKLTQMVQKHSSTLQGYLVTEEDVPEE